MLPTPERSFCPNCLKRRGSAIYPTPAITKSQRGCFPKRFIPRWAKSLTRSAAPSESSLERARGFRANPQLAFLILANLRARPARAAFRPPVSEALDYGTNAGRAIELKLVNRIRNKFRMEATGFARRRWRKQALVTSSTPTQRKAFDLLGVDSAKVFPEAGR